MESSPIRRVIHTFGPKYAVKYHTAAENALSHSYRSCLELLIESGVQSIAMGCMYTEAKNYPREPAAHVAIRTVRRFLEKQKDKVAAVVFCLTTTNDTEIYKRWRKKNYLFSKSILSPLRMQCSVQNECIIWIILIELLIKKNPHLLTRRNFLQIH